jgi:Putative rRNA methylase
MAAISSLLLCTRTRYLVPVSLPKLVVVHKNEADVIIIDCISVKNKTLNSQPNVPVVDGWIFVDMERALVVLTLSIALIGFQEVVSFQQMKSSRICLHRCQFPPNGTRRMLLFVSSGSNKKNEPTVSSTRRLLDGVLDRVDRTLSYKTVVSMPSTIQKNGQLDGTLDEIIASVRDISSARSDELPDVSSDRIESLVSGSVTRSLQTLSANSVVLAVDSLANVGNHVDYSNNPTITTTALAHSLWSYVLRPGMDSAIDATAGNGGDSVTIAKMLFPQYVDVTNNLDTSGESEIDTKSQLIAIDVQESACRNTTERLAAVLPSSLLRNNVRILHSSHAILPVPKDSSSIALIVYNLGFLPGSKTKDSVTTSTTSTIASLANAARILRNGGMLSVATYPRTSKEEDIAVRAFMEGLALFSSATQSWSEYIQNVAFDGSSATPQILRDQLEGALREVYEDDRKKKWRVTEHKKLGRLDAPILFTAVRIM